MAQHGSDLALVYRGLDTGLVGVSVSVWPQGVGGQFFGSFGLQGGVSIDSIDNIALL